MHAGHLSRLSREEIPPSPSGYFELHWIKGLPSSRKKHMFVSHTKHTQRKINESTSFTIDNIYYVNFRI